MNEKNNYELHYYNTEGLTRAVFDKPLVEVSASTCCSSWCLLSAASRILAAPSCLSLDSISSCCLCASNASRCCFSTNDHTSCSFCTVPQTHHWLSEMRNQQLLKSVYHCLNHLLSAVRKYVVIWETEVTYQLIVHKLKQTNYVSKFEWLTIFNCRLRHLVDVLIFCYCCICSLFTRPACQAGSQNCGYAP